MITPKPGLKLITLLTIGYFIALSLWIQVQPSYKSFLFATVYAIFAKSYPIIDQTIEYKNNNDADVKLVLAMPIYSKPADKNTAKPVGIKAIMRSIGQSDMKLPIIFAVPKIESAITRYVPISGGICLVYLFYFRRLNKLRVLVEVAIILLFTHVLILSSYFLSNINNNLNAFEMLLNQGGLTARIDVNNKIFTEIVAIVYSYLTDLAVYFEPFLIGIYLYRKNFMAIQDANEQKALGLS